MVADFTMQAQPAAINVGPSAPGTSTISVIPLGGSTSTVALSCAPQAGVALTCAFSPATVTLDGVNPGVVKVTVSSGAAAASAVAASASAPWGIVSTVAFAGLLLPLGRRRKLRRAFGMIAIVGLALLAFGCGSSNSDSSTPKAGTYVVNVTATAGGISRTLPLVVTVVK